MEKQYYEEFRASIKTLIQLSEGIKTLLNERLKIELKDILPQIEVRVKAIQSLEYKIDAKYPSPKSIFEIDDLIGIRVIFISESQQSIAIEIIENEFSVLNYKDTSVSLDEDQFGYASKHLICEINEELLAKINLKEGDAIIGHKFEIQTRTFAQHIFSQLSHKYNYKSTNYIPDKIKRPLYRIAALSELIDQEINNFEKAREAHINGYNPKDINDALNIRSIIAFCQNRFENYRNLGEAEDYERIIRDLKHFGIVRISDLEEIVSKNIVAFNEAENKLIQKLVDLPKMEREIFRDHIEKNFLYSHTGVLRSILKEEFKGSYIIYKTEVLEQEVWGNIIDTIEEHYPNAE